MAETLRLVFESLIEKYPGYYEIEQVALFHVYAVTTPKWPVYPTNTIEVNGERRLDPADKWGQLTFPKTLAQSKPDLVFAFNDPQYLIPLAVNRTGAYKLIFYTNFDGVPPFFKNTPLSKADIVVTMSHFALSILRKTHPRISNWNSMCIYSPADGARFKPLRAEHRLQAKKELMPDCIPEGSIVLGWVGVNSWRKQVWLVYKIIKYIREGAYAICCNCGHVNAMEWCPIDQTFVQSLTSDVPTNKVGCRYCGAVELKRAKPLKNVVLWVHMTRDDPFSSWPVPLLEETFGVVEGVDVVYTDGHKMRTGVIPEHMGYLYQMFDILLYLSGGEGFGIPVWEAMCSGVPVVYTNYSSHAELVSMANAGLPVGGVFQPQAGDCVMRIIADVEQTIEAVLRLILDPALRDQLGDNGVKYTDRFSVQQQVDVWHKLFQNVLS